MTQPSSNCSICRLNGAIYCSLALLALGGCFHPDVAEIDSETNSGGDGGLDSEDTSTRNEQDAAPDCDTEDTNIDCHVGDVYELDSCGNPVRLVKNCHDSNATCEETDCICKNHWTGDNCENCPGNWDPTKQCNACKGNWDPAEDCAACRDGWTGASCEECPANWDKNNDCATCLETYSGDSCKDRCMRYVRTDGELVGDGLSWATAYQTVQQGIDAAAAAISASNQTVGCEVWVSAGIYYIYQSSPSNTVRLASGIELYGGFTGSEIQRKERDWRANPTVLTGYSENSTDELNEQVYHVVTGANDAVIDGFVIRDGQVYDESADNLNGAGMHNDTCSPTIRNCVFVDNRASQYGGGIYGWDSSPTIENCIFVNNVAGYAGGALMLDQANVEGSAVIRDTLFVGNWANSFGAGILLFSERDETHNLAENTIVVGNSILSPGGWVSDSDAAAGICTSRGSLSIMNSTIVGNWMLGADGFGGGLHGGGLYTHRGQMTVQNSIVWGNGPDEYNAGGGGAFTFSYSDVRGITDLDNGNFSANPSFVAYAPQSGGIWGAVFYDESQGQTRLIDGAASFAANSLIGKFVRINAQEGVESKLHDRRWALIAANSATEIRVWGRINFYDETMPFGYVDCAEPGDPYEIYDLHLSDSSPCIDAADGNLAPPEDYKGALRYDHPDAADAVVCGDVDAGCILHVDIGAIEYTP